ncbi:hypothetical protein ACIP88_05055 [Streptomyces uncialis]|uniref:hypothetical protein n=1 Tax=Streptomyces uncialis TaxID=1048205 RepID=UPI0037F968A3
MSNADIETFNGGFIRRRFDRTAVDLVFSDPRVGLSAAASDARGLPITGIGGSRQNEVGLPIDVWRSLIACIRADVVAERDAAQEARDTWKEIAERNDAATAPLRIELRRTKQERGALTRRVEELHRAATPDADELRDVIVSQAREIARLKDETE